jgi:uncharacterized membrane protein YfcA
MNMTGLALAGASAAVAGAINSAAGGGSFISFPTLVFLGVPPIAANATNTAAMWIGQAGSIRGFKDDMVKPSSRFTIAMIVSALGGIAGALLLLHTPVRAFNAVIPWLLLFATLVFAFAPLVLKFAKRVGEVEDIAHWHSIVLFVIAVYGGYFGGGQGLVILAFFALIGMTNLRKMNALKSVLAFINNGVPVIPFAFAHALEWDVAVVMCIGAIIGGYYGAVVVKRVPPRIMRAIIVAIGAATTIAFFIRAR